MYTIITIAILAVAIYAGVKIYQAVRIRREEVLLEKRRLDAAKRLRDEEAQRRREAAAYLQAFENFEALSVERQHELAVSKTVPELNEQEIATCMKIATGWIREQKLTTNKIAAFAANDAFSSRFGSILGVYKKIEPVTALDMEFLDTCLRKMKIGAPTVLLSIAGIKQRSLSRRGWTPITCRDLVVDRPCYLKSEVEAVNLRKQDGELFYDMDNRMKSTVYLFEDALELVNTRHLSLPLTDIVGIALDKEMRCRDRHAMLMLTVRNRANLNLWCKTVDLTFLLAAVPLIKQQGIPSGKSSDEEPTSRKAPDPTPSIRPEKPSEVFLKPWAGAHYEKGIHGQRLLVLGESHYALPETWSSDFTVCRVREYLDPACERENWMKTYTKFERALAGRELSPSERKDWWDRFMFWNFIQQPMESVNRSLPTDDAISTGQHAFLEILATYRPDRIIVWGERLYGWLPDRGRQGEPVALKEPWKDGKHYSLETWEYELPDGRTCRVLPIEHPARGFAWDYYHLFIEEFLK